MRNTTFLSNTYLCRAAGSAECAVVDPGMDVDVIIETLAEQQLAPAVILCTHGHFDHIGSAHALQLQYGARMYLHRSDLKTMRAANFFLTVSRMGLKITTPTPDELVGDGAEVTLGASTFRFHHTPGHTPGSCVIEFGDSLFSGDTLYRMGVEANSLPGENIVHLRESIRLVLERFGERVRVYPGHGGSATLGEIKRSNTALRTFLDETAS